MSQVNIGLVKVIVQSSEDGASLLMDATLCCRFKVYNGSQAEVANKTNNADCVH